MRKKAYLLHTYKKGVYQKAEIFHSGTSVIWFLRKNGGALSQSALTGLDNQLLVVDGRGGLSFEVEELES